MSEETVYVIADQIAHEDYNSRDWIEEVIDPGHGYFTDQTAAQAYADELNAPGKARYAEEAAAFDAKMQKWERKQARAHAQGFANPDHRPWGRPTEPLSCLVIEIKAAR